MKLITLILSILIVITAAGLFQQIISNSISNQQNKNDYAELNNVKYGLFSVEEWKRQITVILVEEINKLDFSQTNDRDLRKHIEVLMNRLIDEVGKKIREGNAGTAKGWAKQSFIDMFISLKDIKKGIPQYADAVFKEITKSKTKAQVKSLLNKKLKQYLDQTVEKKDTANVSRILLSTNSRDIGSARIKLDKAISSADGKIIMETTLLICLSGILFALSGFSRQPLHPSRYILLVLSLIILLVVGVTTPMIDMEAKISKMSFMLIGHPVTFENQVLYFQSKSILDVFWIMITHKDIQMKFVGFLMVSFSVFFPLLKLLSSAGYYYNFKKARESRLIKFFVFESGKWSMADVTVVAIFMAYIGFNGIISSQFGQLSSVSEELTILTTNGTSLQPGFFLFMAYSLLAMFLPGLLTRKPLELTP